MAATGISAARSVKASSSRDHAAVAAIAARTAASSFAATARLAPSPPKTKGNGRRDNAFVTAAMTDAPAVFTAL